MESILNIIKKYDCVVVEGRVLTKSGADTKMNLDGMANLLQILSSVKNKDEQQKEILDIFEEELKMRNEVLTNG